MFQEVNHDPIHHEPNVTNSNKQKERCFPEMSIEEEAEVLSLLQLMATLTYEQFMQQFKQDV